MSERAAAMVELEARATRGCLDLEYKANFLRLQDHHHNSNHLSPDRMALRLLDNPQGLIVRSARLWTRNELNGLKSGR